MILSATNVSNALALGLSVGLCTRDGFQLGIAHRGDAEAPKSPDLRAVTMPGGVRFEALTPDGEAFLELMAEAA